MVLGKTSLSINVLGSSSAGNCGLLNVGAEKYFVDAGFSGKKTLSLLEAAGATFDDISGVFITHEHIDHINCLTRLSKIDGMKFFANKETAAAVAKKLKLDINWSIIDVGVPFNIGELQIDTCKIPHDSANHMCYFFRHKSDSTGGICWMTDIGHVTNGMARIAKMASHLVLEANHDVDMLIADKTRPWSIKERILSDVGHLSNDDAFNFISSMEFDCLKELTLIHLSKDCNSTKIVLEKFNKFCHDRNIVLKVIDPDTQFTN